MTAALVLLGPIWSARARPLDVLAEARRQLLSQNHEAAAALLDTAAVTPEGYYLLGRARQALFQDTRAADAFARADTSRPDVLAAWGQSLRRLGRTDEALRRYRAAYRQDSTARHVALPLAQLYARSGAWQKAKPIYARLLETDAENAFLHAQLGAAYRGIDSLQAATRHYERAYALNPQSIEILLRLSRLYQEAGVPDMAVMMLGEALHQRPENARLWQRLTEVALRNAQYGIAITSAENAIRYGDTTATNLGNLGAALYSGGFPKASLLPLRQAFWADTTQPSTTFYLGLAEKAAGRPDTALVYLERAARLYSRATLANLYEQMGDAYHEAARPAEAIRADRVALGLDPGRHAVRFHLATLYDGFYADPSAALAQYEAFLKRVPEEVLTGLQAQARRRIRAIKERQFFDGGAPSSPAPSDTAQRRHP